jgi:hypothetical protein
MEVNPPAGLLGTVLTSAGLVVGAVALGAYAGGAYQTDPTRTAAAKSAGGSLAGLLAALGGLGLALRSEKWRAVGTTTALLSVGLYTAGVAALATATGAPLGNPTVTAPQTLVVSTTGQTVNLHVGDTVYAQLPDATGSSWSWLSSNPPVASALPQIPATTGAPTENDGFTATQTGTTLLTASQKDASGNTLQTFTLTVAVT